MSTWSKFFGTRSRPVTRSRKERREVNREGWEAYARGWEAARDLGQIPDLNPSRAGEAQYLGDEWSLMEDTEFRYGVDVRSVQAFAEYIDARLLSPHLPARRDLTIMEIGPGGGRITNLLLPRARKLYAVDVSEAMLQRLRERFPAETRIVPIVTDGIDIEGIEDAGLDAVVSFDAFVHIEPWEIFRYLETAGALLRKDGVGIVHFSDVETSIGFKLFRSQVPSVVRSGADFSTFSVMSKSIMRTFLQELGFEIVVITNDIVPRDAVAVFRKSGASQAADR